MKPTPKYVRSLQVVCSLLFLCTTLAFAQSAPIWTGSITCQLDDEEQGVYQRQEIQTWTLTGAPPDNPNSIPLYQATWQAQAQGQLLRAQGTQTTSIQWVANVPAPGGQAPTVPIVIRVRAADGRLVIGQWRAALNVPNALTAQRQTFVNGVPQGQPVPFSRGLQEWKFPLIEAPNDSTINGTSQAQADAGSAEVVHRYGGLPPAATCQWKLSKGASAVQNPGPTMGNSFPNQNPQGSQSGNSGAQTSGQNCESPATVQQSFETMKADLQAQYDKLIQGTGDPNEIASLKNQEQRMIANLNNQEQRDMTLASQGCLQATNTAGGNSAGAASGGAAGAAGSAGGGSAAGGGANAGAAGGAGAAGAAGGTAGSAGGGSAAAGGASASGGTGAAGAAGGSANAGGATSGGSTASGGSAGGAASGQGAGSSGGGATGSTQAQLVSLSPSSISQGSTTSVRLTGQGTHWQTQSTSLSFGPQITVQSFTADPGGTSGTANITVAADASTGSRPVMLMTGAEMVGLPAGLTVTAAQQGSSSGGSGSNGGLKFGTPNQQLPSLAMLTGVSPATNNGQSNLTVTLTGQLTHFATGSTKVSFARSATQPQGTSISQPANAALQALRGGTSTPPALQAGQVQASTGTSLSVPVTMNPATAAGSYDIAVTTPVSSGTETVTLKNVFTVTNTPSLTGVNIIPGTVPKNVGSSTPSPASATYRVVITGLMCMKHISSDDAVYAAAVVRQYDRRNNQNTMSTNLNTWVYGDVNGLQGQRKQAGTRGPGGGIGDGDLVPTGFMPGTRDTMPTPQVNNLLPLTVWEGTLTDGIDALVISPSLWVNYGDNQFFGTWNQNEDSFTNSIFTDSRVQDQIKTQTLSTLVLGSSQTVGGSFAQSFAGDTAQAVIDTVLVIPFVELQGNPSHDRPVGVVDASATDPTASMILPNTTLVLTREMIEKRLGSGSWMMMPLVFNDTAHGFTGMIGSDRPGQYQMFIQIERQ